MGQADCRLLEVGFRSCDLVMQGAIGIHNAGCHMSPLPTVIQCSEVVFLAKLCNIEKKRKSNKLTRSVESWSNFKILTKSKVSTILPKIADVPFANRQ